MIGLSSDRKRWGFGPAFFLILFLPVLVCAGELNFFGQFRLQAISEPEPVNGMLGNWGDEFESGKRQWIDARTELGVRYGSGLEVSLFARALADLRFNEEAARFYGRVKRDEALMPGEQIPVKVSAHGFTGDGLRIGYRVREGGWDVALGGSLFKADYLLEGDLWGEMLAKTPEDFSFEASIDYVYYEDLIFGREDTSRPEGVGWSGDLVLAWQAHDHLRFEFAAEDLFARIRWTDVPATRTLEPVSLDRRIQDSKQAPVGLWAEGTIDRYYQDIDPRYRLSLDWNADAWHGSLRGQYQFGYGYAGVGGGYRFANGFAVTGLFWPEYDQFGIEAKSGNWRGTLVLDQFDWNEVQAMSVGIAYGY
ncbi:hypothetical protein B9Q17_13260 [Marinobacter vinifirmus]|uniref:Uncharacterized protein n=1 Tax=Marinobacter vinifirmus TaxID=355591 RepID=A0A7Z1INX6_9GAMM|nr:hypothetical protein [Marinobacter vinifirmus]OZC37509.1 hypothetical protein B9Q17_13260 [Marinobacter vinifirmus]